MKKMSELKREIEAALVRQTKTAELVTSENPITRWVGLLVQERVDVFEAVLASINGDRATLSCYK